MSPDLNSSLPIFSHTLVMSIILHNNLIFIPMKLYTTGLLYVERFLKSLRIKQQNDLNHFRLQHVLTRHMTESAYENARKLKLTYGEIKYCLNRDYIKEALY